MIESIYNAGYGIWNHLIEIAMTLFTVSPTAANGSVYATANALYTSIADISVPIAIIFFLLAIFKDVVSTPPDQQARRFLGDALKFGIMVGILINLWTIMGYVIQIADGITDKFASGSAITYQLTVSSDLQSVINELDQDVTIFSGEMWNQIKATIILLIASMATFVIIVSSAIAIISCSFQRIIKPLAILPLSSITVALAAGSGDASRVTTSYIKTFFGFCISGAFMVICVKMGVALGNGLIAFDMSTLTLTEKALYISVQNAVIPLVIAGLIKSTDSIIARFF